MTDGYIDERKEIPISSSQPEREVWHVRDAVSILGSGDPRRVASKYNTC